MDWGGYAPAKTGKPAIIAMFLARLLMNSPGQGQWKYLLPCEGSGGLEWVADTYR